MTKVFTFGNQKGGTGKSTTTVMLSYLLHAEGKKVLVIDFDPQANCTFFLTNTYEYKLADNYTSLYESIEQGDLSTGLLHLDDGFDLLPSDVDLLDFPELARKQIVDEKEDSYFLLDYLLNKIKHQYDYVFIDTPADMNEFTNNALVAADFVTIILQTHLFSFHGAIRFKKNIEALQRLNPELQLLGLLPSLAKSKAKIDDFILETARDEESEFQDMVFTNCIYYRERMHRYTINGIKFSTFQGVVRQDTHDRQLLGMYQSVLDELMEKAGEKDEN